jgi:hypothetical protein
VTVILGSDGRPFELDVTRERWVEPSNQGELSGCILWALHRNRLWLSQTIADERSVDEYARQLGFSIMEIMSSEGATLPAIDMTRDNDQPITEAQKALATLYLKVSTS